MASIVPLIIMALSASAALQAQALQILSLSPQGEVAQVRQVVARFDGAAVNFGDPKAPAPLALSCSDAQAAKGAGRWTSDREWIFEFDKDLPPGVNCTVSPVSSFKSPSSAILASAISYKFNSGGPFIQNLRPGRYQPIDEEQYFVLELNGPATKDSLLDKVWCSVEGRIQRDFWSPRKDLDVRKLAALEALSRHGKAQGRMTGSITIAPNQWPTNAVIDWLNILKRVADVPQRSQRLLEANQILKSRLSYQGTKLVFSTEKDDYWWWLMVNGDVNTARLMLAVMDDATWKDDMARLANGFIARQQKGAWHTTTANLWGGLALDKFSAKFEAVPVAGLTTASLAGTSAKVASVDWDKVERIKTVDAAGEAHQTTFFGAPAAPGMLRDNSLFLAWSAAPGKDTLTVTHQGSGKPWLTLQSLAAVPLKAPLNAGYQISKAFTPVEQAHKGRYTRGDVLRVTLEVNASADTTWVVVSDPIPGGATILGGGMGRDSQIATGGEKKAGTGWPAFKERSVEAFRRYYEYLPKGIVKLDYTIRLNNVGDFALPPSRVEAMYAPEMFGEAPNARVEVDAAK